MLEGLVLISIKGKHHLPHPHPCNTACNEGAAGSKNAGYTYHTEMATRRNTRRSHNGVETASETVASSGQTVKFVETIFVLVEVCHAGYLSSSGDAVIQAAHRQSQESHNPSWMNKFKTKRRLRLEARWRDGVRKAPSSAKLTS